MVRPAPLHMYTSLNFEIMVEHLFDEFLTLTQLGPYGELCLCEGVNMEQFIQKRSSVSFGLGHL